MYNVFIVLLSMNELVDYYYFLSVCSDLVAKVKVVKQVELK